jgi:hypothetical protein
MKRQTKEQMKEMLKKIEGRTNEEVAEEFNNIVDSLDNEQFWYWVSRWYDVDNIRKCFQGLDKETMENEIERIEKIKKSNRGF